MAILPRTSGRFPQCDIPFARERSSIPLMIRSFPRVLLALSAVILMLGGLMHARAFGKTRVAVAASNLETFYAGSLKALWLIDSATLFTLAIVFALAAFRPSL